MWEIVGIFLSVIAVMTTIIGANYFFIKDVKQEIKTDMDSFKSDIKIDMEKFEKRMEIIDTRWASLFERFHILDKDMEKFRVANNN